VGEVQPEVEMLGEVVRQVRLDRGVSGSEFAKAVGISPSYVCKIENQGAVPTEKIIVKMAAALGVAPERFLTAAGKLPKDVMHALQLQPEALCKLIRALSGAPAERVNHVVDYAKSLNRNPSP
jgi:transcriptional regulator with XRE-family HTH domain